MKSSTAERTGSGWRSPMRLAWAGALALFLLAAALLAAFPGLRQSVITLTPPSKPDPEELERRRAQIKKPEPTERQVREIAERVEKKKTDELRRKVRTLEAVREEMERTAEAKREALGLEPEDVFKALVEAIRRKAADVESTGELRAESTALRAQADGLQQFDSLESPGLEPAARALAAAVEAMEESLGRRLDALPPEDTYHRVRVGRAQGHVRQLGDLVARLLRSLPGVEAPVVPLSEETLQAMDAAALYDQARALDEAIRQEFADARAAELAAVQDQTLGEALARVDVPESAAPDLTGALSQNQPSSREEFRQYNEALDQAASAMTAMELSAQGMAAQARGFAAEGRSAETARASQLQQAMRSAAAAPDGSVVDMTPMMRNLYALQRGDSGSSGADPVLGGAAPLMQGGAGTELGASTAASGARMRPLRPHEIVPQLLPGRKFTRSSDRRGWLYIDTWYVIGPFQKPEGDRLSYDTRFPPETRVDLDGQYPGKIDPQSGRPVALRWRFFQSNTLRITPPDEIDGSVYYAYTEVWFEEDEEVLVAVASDDAAKVWVNDLVVWEDAGLSPWRLDEGFRKVLFRRGYNSVLVRIENGPVVCQFSLLLCPVGLER